MSKVQWKVRKKDSPVCRKPYLDKQVALTLGLSFNDVREITAAFIDVISEELAELHDVQLTNLGTLHVFRRKSGKHMLRVGRPGLGRKSPLVRVKFTHKFGVSFSKSVPLRKAIQQKQGRSGKILKDEEA